MAGGTLRTSVAVQGASGLYDDADVWPVVALKHVRVQYALGSVEMVVDIVEKTSMDYTNLRVSNDIVVEQHV